MGAKQPYVVGGDARRDFKIVKNSRKILFLTYVTVLTVLDQDPTYFTDIINLLLHINGGRYQRWECSKAENVEVFLTRYFAFHFSLFIFLFSNFLNFKSLSSPL